ncbi:protein sprint [Ditylenchus destructor]|uniref:Protein sprint n=1 Tax=Ditylenchus destructor TaxID=166010 RepID=A0AAD4NDR6_9BILA|nr:protein sprint [Ditylenchus destructor]
MEDTADAEVGEINISSQRLRKQKDAREGTDENIQPDTRPTKVKDLVRPHAPPPKLKAFGRTSISKNNSNMSSPAFDSSLCSSIAYTVSPPPYSPSGMALSQSSAEAGGGARTGATLLEQIIKSHPIWYLQHLGRAAANHLLRPMEPGVFIVRASSRTSNNVEEVAIMPEDRRKSKRTTMALSVRLPAECSTDIDHYLIETVSSDSSCIRLEGSPLMFKNLPILLHHYCLNGEELQTRLCLPWAISSCQSIQGLQAFALMGPDFWTSEASRMASPMSPTSVKSQQSTHQSGVIARQAPMVMHNPLAFGPPKPPKQQNGTSKDVFQMSRSISSMGPEQFFKKSGTSKHIAGIFQQKNLGKWLNQPTPMAHFDASGDPSLNIEQGKQGSGRSSLMRQSSSTNFTDFLRPSSIKQKASKTRKGDGKTNSAIWHTDQASTSNGNVPAYIEGEKPRKIMDLKHGKSILKYY